MIAGVARQLRRLVAVHLLGLRVGKLQLGGRVRAEALFVGDQALELADADVRPVKLDRVVRERRPELEVDDADGGRLGCWVGSYFLRRRR